MNTAPLSTLHDVPHVLRRLVERARLADASSGAIASAAAGATSGAGGGMAEHGPRTAEAMLGALLDVAATVRMADHLAIRASVASPIRAEADARSALRVRVDRKLGDLRAELAEGLRQPFEGRRAAPGAAETHEALRAAGLLEESRDPEKLRAVARRLAGFHRERFDHHLSRGRQRLRWVRIDVTAEIRALGPRAAELEAFDTVFMRACEPTLAKLTQRLERCLDACFESLFIALANELPLGATVHDLAPWFAPRGPLVRHHADLGALAAALVDHDIDALLALVDTAWASRSEEINA